jgi:uncharacterized protein DUF5946
VSSPQPADERAPFRAQFDDLCFYTLAHGDPAFIHQHVVDAFAAQNATADTKPIAITFALIGLFLHLERGYTGREVQLAHMHLARPPRREWPRFTPPEHRGAMHVGHVLTAPAGPDRDRAIDSWCRSVWDAWQHAREEIVNMCDELLPARQQLRAYDKQQPRVP